MMSILNRRISSCDVTSGNVLRVGSTPAERVGQGGGWFHPQGEDSMAMPVLGYRPPKFSPPMHKWAW